jgi:hypothetical protein
VLGGDKPPNDPKEVQTMIRVKLTEAERGYLLMLLREARRANQRKRDRLAARFGEDANLTNVEAKEDLRAGLAVRLGREQEVRR